MPSALAPVLRIPSLRKTTKLSFFGVPPMLAGILSVTVPVAEPDEKVIFPFTGVHGASESISFTRLPFKKIEASPYKRPSIGPSTRAS